MEEAPAGPVSEAIKGISVARPGSALRDRWKATVWMPNEERFGLWSRDVAGKSIGSTSRKDGLPTLMMCGSVQSFLTRSGMLKHHGYDVLVVHRIDRFSRKRSVVLTNT